MRQIKRLFSSTFVVSVLTLAMPVSALGIESTWTVNGSGTEWFGGAPWTNGVPNQPGDIATLYADSSGAVTAGLSQMATIGELRMQGTQLTLAGPGGLLLDSPSTAQPQIFASGAQSGILFDIATPINVASDQELLIDVSSGSTLRLSGELVIGTEAVHKRGDGIVILTRQSNNWVGDLDVEAGEVRVEHTLALANTFAVNTLSGGLLTIVSQSATPEVSQDPYLIPRLVLDGGTLQTNTGAPRHTTRLAAEVELLSESVIQVPSGDVLFLQGGITGRGSVRFLHRADGGSSAYLEISEATSYSGETFIGPNMRVGFRNSAALGDASAGTLVSGGTLELYEGGGNENIIVEHGQLRLVGAAAPYGHAITLIASQLSGGEVPPAVLTNAVEFAEGALLGTEAGADDLVIAGGMTGTGSLAIQNDVEIQNGLSARGNLYIRNRSGAKLSGPVDLAGEVFFDRSTLQVLTDIGAHDTRFRVVTTSEVADSTLTFTATNTVHSVVLDPRQANRDETFEFAQVIVGGDATLTVTDELRFLGGRLQGKILGQAVLTKQDRAMGILENIAGSGFTRVNVEAGQLTVRGNSGPTPPEIELQGHDLNRIILSDTSVYPGVVRLNNAGVYNREAALTLTGSTVFDGNVFLGSLGSSVGGSGQFGPNAAIHGGDLILLGNNDVRLRSGGHTYSGETRLMAQSLILSDQGRLNSTSAVAGGGRFSNGGGRGGLVLDNNGTALNDRIPDSTPVHLNGMMFTLKGTEGASVSETLGTVHATRGIGDIIIEDPSSAGSTELRMQTLNRLPGAAVQFRTNNSTARIVLDQPPSLDDGLIGGWAIVDAFEFATYGPNGVVSYSQLHSYATNLNTATASSNVLMLGGSATLSSNKSINSLTTNQGTINLNGRTLTVESGGLLSRTSSQTTILGPGQLTAGTEAGAELLITGNARIESNIVDNPNGAVGLTHSLGVLNNGALLALSGINTYSGPTVVNSGNSTAVLEALTRTALPAGGDIFLNGGELYVNFATTEPLPLGRMELRDSAIVRTTLNVNPELQPESIFVESGEFLTKIVGDAPITKVGPLAAHFYESLGTHTGPVTVEEGDFFINAIGPAPVDDAHAITILRGGRLRSSSDFVAANRKLRLDGGVIDLGLRGGIAAPLEILSGGGTLRNGRGITVITSAITGDGTLVVEGGLGNGVIDLAADLSNFNGLLRFTGGNITVRGDLKYDGQIQVTTADLGTSGGTPFGEAEVVLLPDGQLSVGNPLTANLRLNGGVLKMHFGNNLQSPVLSGKLSVADHSYLFINPGTSGIQTRPRITSDLTLEDDSNLIITQTPSGTSNVQLGLFRDQLFIQSNLNVDGSVTLTSFDIIVEITGTIMPMSDNAVLNLVGNDTFELKASINLSNGASLSIFEGNVPATIALSGGTNSLAGNGALTSDVTLSAAAFVSPGTSAGAITVHGDVTVGGGALYLWEVTSAHGAAGVEWDLLRVEGTLDFDATPANPWVLKLSDLPGFSGLSNNSLLIATAESIQSFDPEAVRVDITGIYDGLPSIAAKQFSVYADGANLYLRIVPEPSTMSLGLLISTAAAFWMRPPQRKA